MISLPEKEVTVKLTGKMRFEKFANNNQNLGVKIVTAYFLLGVYWFTLLEGEIVTPLMKTAVILIV